MIESLFLNSSVERLRLSESRIQYCLERLTPEQIWWRGADQTNSVANLVLHLCGNVRQWIISSIGGATDVRDRDAEFDAREGTDPANLRRLLTETVSEATKVLERVPPERLKDVIQVQVYEKTVLEAIYHVIEHFALHTGQILYITKLVRNEDLGFYKYLNKKK